MSTPPLTPLAAAVLHVGRPERVLDLTCGDGETTLFLAREFPAARVRGVDSSDQAVREAAARVGLDPEGRVAFKRGRPGALPFPDDHFDLITALDSRPSPPEAGRLLRGGGFLVLAQTRGDGGGAAARLLRWRLGRRRFEDVHAASAGDGSFSVLRLTDR